MALGFSKGTSAAHYCSVSSTRQRYDNGQQSNEQVIQMLKKSLNKKTSKKRNLYYILLTDADLPHPSKSIYFPGHVFILERSWDDKYLLYQSYINEYDLNGHVLKNNHSFSVNSVQVKEIIDYLEYILVKTDRWDEKCVHAWKAFTHVDTSSWLNAECGNDKILICAYESDTDDCFEVLKSYIASKIELLSTELSKNPLKRNLVYGEESSYALGTSPLTNDEMLKTLLTLKDDINIDQNRFSSEKKED
jgi:hypothetical protein